MEELKPFASQALQVIDVGARGGIHRRWRSLLGRFPLQVIGFEADARECAELNRRKDTAVRYLPCALGAEDGTRNLQLLVGEASSSFFKPNFALIDRSPHAVAYQLQREIPLPIRPLDSVLAAEAITGIDFLKIDTEGYELEILRGAPQTLAGVFGVELEVWFSEVFQGAPRFREVDAFMVEKGFTLFDVARSNWFKRKDGAKLGGPRSQLVAGDAIYFRDFAALPPESVFFDREKFVRSLIVLTRYGFYDVALEATTIALGHGRLTAAEAAAIREWLHREGRRTMFDFRGKHTLEKLAKKLGRWLTKFEGDYLGNW